MRDDSFGFWSDSIIIIIREEVFITSKVFNNHHEDRVPAALRNTLKNLKLDYLVSSILLIISILHERGGDAERT